MTCENGSSPVSVGTATTSSSTSPMSNMSAHRLAEHVDNVKLALRQKHSQDTDSNWPLTSLDWPALRTLWVTGLSHGTWRLSGSKACVILWRNTKSEMSRFTLSRTRHSDWQWIYAHTSRTAALLLHLHSPLCYCMIVHQWQPCQHCDKFPGFLVAQQLLLVGFQMQLMTCFPMNTINMMYVCCSVHIVPWRLCCINHSFMKQRKLCNNRKMCFPHWQLDWYLIVFKFSGNHCSPSSWMSFSAIILTYHKSSYNLIVYLYLVFSILCIYLISWQVISYHVT